MTINLPRNPFWHDKAACKGTYDPVFFPLTETDQAVAYVRDAYCNTCPVRVDCLNDANRTRSYGVWAGTSSELRAKLRKSRHRSKCPGCEERQVVKIPGSQICLSCGLSWPIPEKTGP